ncbi:hypothetical protein [Pontibacter pamirensis]|uniref:hypothetical protein n=1 Tax=Pontibacter pamirensis TaxID=2562824 RepID=UPI0013897310|nr:hypothetical protein [Pontibacter pamirensis]
MNLLKRIMNIQSQFEFVEDSAGLHQLGGEIPRDFKIPENEFKGGFQYLGYIENKDKFFDWLPFKLNLICPIFLDFDYVFLDYENANEPKLLYPLNTSEITTAYDELDKDSRVTYNSLSCSLKPFKGVDDDNEFEIIGLAGRPHWIQAEDYPICPKTKKKMKFVCQLMSNGHVKAKSRNFRSEDDYYEKIFEEMNFWCDGALKVFFEPTSKVACYFIQNT